MAEIIEYTVVQLSLFHCFVFIQTVDSIFVV